MAPKQQRWLGLMAWVLIGFGAGLVGAHDSPEHEVERLTVLMAREGRTTSHLMDRATEYRAMGRPDLAAVDLKEAIQLRPEETAPRLELSRVQLAVGDVTDALITLERGMKLVTDEAALSPYYMVRAEVLVARGDFAEALADCDRAFQQETVDLDWYLIRSRVQARTGSHEARIAGLEQGKALTGSFVLEIEWIEALTDGGQYQRALDAIEPELEASRLQSSWRIRRARVMLGMGRREEAEKDLGMAIEEMRGRLRTDNPDLTLLVDLGVARALLEDKAGARRDMGEARRRGAEGWMLWRLERLLGQND